MVDETRDRTGRIQLVIERSGACRLAGYPLQSQGVHARAGVNRPAAPFPGRAAVRLTGKLRDVPVPVAIHTLDHVAGADAVFMTERTLSCVNRS